MKKESTYRCIFGPIDGIFLSYDSKVITANDLTTGKLKFPPSQRVFFTLRRSYKDNKMVLFVEKGKLIHIYKEIEEPTEKKEALPDSYIPIIHTFPGKMTHFHVAKIEDFREGTYL